MLNQADALGAGQIVPVLIRLLSKTFTGKIINFITITLADCHYSDDEFVVYDLIHKAKTGCS